MGKETHAGRQSSVEEQVRVRLLMRLRALMAHSVANGATEAEELAAARMVGKLIAQLDGTPNAASASATPPAPAPELRPASQPSWAEAERKSPEYQRLLEKNVMESLFKAAVQELSLNHINTVSPPRRRIAGEPVERVDTRAMMEPHLSMVLAPGGMMMARHILADTIEELIQDGALPPWLDIPLGD